MKSGIRRAMAHRRRRELFLWLPPLVLGLLLVAALWRGDVRWSVENGLRSSEAVPSEVVRDGRSRGGIGPGDDELVAVLVTATFCPAARRQDLQQALPDLFRILAQRAESQELRLRRVGLSLDWDPLEGVEYLSGLAEFDEIIAGGNWVNEGTLRYIWDAHPGSPAVPQLVLVHRRLSFDEAAGWRITGEEVQARVVGVEEILRWIQLRLGPDAIDGPAS